MKDTGVTPRPGLERNFLAMTMLMTVMLISMLTGCLLVGALAAISSAEARRQMRRIAAVSRRHPRQRARQGGRGGYSA